VQVVMVPFLQLGLETCAFWPVTLVGSPPVTFGVLSWSKW